MGSDEMIVVDTHVLLWSVIAPENLSAKAKKLLKQEEDKGRIFVSSISVWEIYLLVKKGRIRLSIDTDRWVEQLERLPFVEFISIDNRIAATSVTLPGEFHGDPADRIIVATAREMGVSLLTIDEKIRNYPHVQTVW